MSRFDRDQRDAEKAARRARRLAERAEQRARRRAEQARRAAERADTLAQRAGRRSDSKRSLEDHIDDVVEDYTEKWGRKVDGWFGSGTSSSRRASTAGKDYDEIRAERRARRRAARDRRTAEARAQRRRRRSSGWRFFRLRFNSGRGLYRDKARGRILGVCAGMADYLDVEVWQVRLVAVLGLIFAGQVAVPVYFILYFLMDKKPYYRRMTDNYDDSDEEDEVDDLAPRQSRRRAERPRDPAMNQGVSNVEKLRVAREKFSDLEERLRSMESHVTSSRFELQRELRKISGEDA